MIIAWSRWSAGARGIGSGYAVIMMVVRSMFSSEEENVMNSDADPSW